MLNLIFLVFILDGLEVNSYKLEFLIVFFIILSTIIILFLLPGKPNLRNTISMFFFGANLFHVLYLYFQTKTYAVIGLTLVNVAGFVYSIENIKSPVIEIQKTLNEFNHREKKRMIKEELRGITKDTPKVEVYNVKTPVKKEFIGSLSSKKFHVTTCSYAKKIPDKNKIKFSSKTQALKKKFRACKCVK
ncbi:hypothetical protein JXB41_06790 [Candidatus Woesearchaeota archaeon]|nr:hypothetical protein [Candidatus Woesearchaeota archaeon]